MSQLQPILTWALLSIGRRQLLLLSENKSEAKDEDGGEEHVCASQVGDVRFHHGVYGCQVTFVISDKTRHGTAQRQFRLRLGRLGQLLGVALGDMQSSLSCSLSNRTPLLAPIPVVEGGFLQDDSRPILVSTLESADNAAGFLLVIRRCQLGEYMTKGTLAGTVVNSVVVRSLTGGPCATTTDVRSVEVGLFETAVRESGAVAAFSALPALTVESAVMRMGEANEYINFPDFAAPNSIVEGLLLPHQRAAVRKALAPPHNGRILVADGMGSGKTLEALAIVSALHRRSLQPHGAESGWRSPFPLLVVAPASVRAMWSALAEQLLYPHYAEKYGDERGARTTRFVWTVNAETQILPVDGACTPMVVVTSASLATTLFTSLMYEGSWGGDVAGGARAVRQWGCVIVDESHFMKPSLSSGLSDSCHSTSCISQLCRSARHCVLLSGTPVAKSPVDAVLQLAAIQPALFDRAYPKGGSDAEVDGKSGDYPPNLPTLFGFDFAEIRCGKRGHLVFGACRRMSELSWLLEDCFWIRRAVATNDANGEDGCITTMGAPMLHRTLVLADISAPLLAVADAGWGALSQAVGLAKVPAVVALIQKLLMVTTDGGSRVVVFAHHRSVLSKLHELLLCGGDVSGVEGDSSRCAVYSIAGDTPMQNRSGIVREFESDHSGRAVLLLSIMACGVGIDLSFGKAAVFAEIPPDSGWLAQAEARLCRPSSGNHTLAPSQPCDVFIVLHPESESHRWELLNRQSQATGPILGAKRSRGATCATEGEMWQTGRIEGNITDEPTNLADLGVRSLLQEANRGAARARVGIIYGWSMSPLAPIAAPVLHIMRRRKVGSNQLLVIAAVAKLTDVKMYIANGPGPFFAPLHRVLSAAVDALQAEGVHWRREMRRLGTILWSTADPPPHGDVAGLSDDSSRSRGYGGDEGNGTERAPHAYNPVVLSMPPHSLEAATLEGYVLSRLPPLPTRVTLGAGRWCYVGITNPHSLPPSRDISFYVGQARGDGALLCLSCRTTPVLTDCTPSSSSHDRVVLPPGATLHDLFCSGECKGDFIVRSGSSARLRRVVEAADGGVCCVCGLDGTALLLALKCIAGPREPPYDSQTERRLRDAVELRAPTIASNTPLLRRLLATPLSAGSVWHADHRVPVHLGGGGCGAENLQTLCVACHAQKTRLEMLALRGGPSHTAPPQP